MSLNEYTDNISDWVSALSTFGTFIIAFAAYKKAPDWINQKINEDGYLNATKILYDSMPKLNSYNNKLRRKINVLHNHMLLVLKNKETNSELIQKLIIDMDESQSELSVLTFQITQEIMALSRFNWRATSFTIKTWSNIEGTVEKLSTIKRDFDTISDPYFLKMIYSKNILDVPLEEIEVFESNLLQISKKINDEHRFLRDSLFSFITNNKPLTFFFKSI